MSKFKRGEDVQSPSADERVLLLGGEEDTRCMDAETEKEGTVAGYVGTASRVRALMWVPIFLPYGGVELWNLAPGRVFDRPHNPLEWLRTSVPILNELRVVATQSLDVGTTNVTATIIPISTERSEMHVVRLHMQWPAERGPIPNGLITITWSPVGLNKQLVDFDGTDMHLIDPTTDSGLTCRFSMRSGAEGGIYVHFARRVTNLAMNVPEKASVRGHLNAAGTTISDRTVAVAATALPASDGTETGLTLDAAPVSLHSMYAGHYLAVLRSFSDAYMKGERP
jgi:hypothetical protein